jgi:Ca-activated chloride channel family protein
LIAFAHPLLLPLAMLAPAALAWLTLIRRRHLRVPSLARVRQPRLAVDAATVLALTAVGVAWLGAAGPRRASQRDVPSVGRDLVVLLDLSASMAGPPGQGDSFAAAQHAVKRLAELRRDDRLGLVAFGGRAAVLSPLTRDHTTFLALASSLAPATLGKETAIGDALAVALEQLRDTRRGSGGIVLVSDGANNAGALDPATAAEAAADRGIPVSTVLVGAEPGTGAISQANESLLQEVARRTGGEFVRARDAKALSAAFEHLAALEPSVAPAPAQRTWIDRSAAPARWAAALLLAAALAELVNRRAWA